MSLWSRILNRGARAFEEGAQETALAPRAARADRDGPRPEAPTDGDVGFTAAVIALSAKLAKADGRVTTDEVDAFARVFEIDRRERAAAARVFDLARQTVRGYDGYARRLARRYRGRPEVLEAVLDALFQIAGADGAVTSDEMAYLEHVAQIFGVDAAGFRRIRAIHLGPEPDDPYAALGLTGEEDEVAVRRAYRRLMAANHPDRVAAIGAPREFQKAAHEKAAAITNAYARIRKERGWSGQAD